MYIHIKKHASAGSTLETISIWFYYVVLTYLVIGKRNGVLNDLEILNFKINRVFKKSLFDII